MAMKWMHKWNTTSHGRMLLWMVLVGNLNGGMAVYGVGLLDSPANGMPSKDVGLHAVYGARIHVSPEEVLTNSWVLVRRDRIEKILKPDEKVPSGYRQWKLGEPDIYAGFIEPYLEIDVPASNTSNPGIHWNERVQPDRQVLSGGLPDEKMREELRKLGFGAAQLVPRNGLVRGFSSVISMAGLSEDRSLARPPILEALQRQVMAFEGGRNPNSLMGQMALMRQVFLDAEWNARQGEIMGPNALDHLHIERSHPRNSGIPATAFLFKVLDEVDHLRADKILKEFGIRNVVMVGTGSEFKRVRAISTDYPIIVPLKFPKAPSIASVGEQESVELRQLMEWEYAPSNAKILLDHGHRVALSTFGGVGEYAANLNKVMESGVSPEQGLSMVTTTPASLIGLESELGKIQAGFRANLVLSDKPLFVPGKVGEIQMSWVDGIPYRVAVDKPQDLKGTWLVQGDFGFDGPVELQITGSKGATLRINETQAEVSHFSMNAGALHFVSRHPAFGDEPLVIFSGSLLDPERGEASRMVGRTVHLDGSGIDWVADFQPKSSAIGKDESPGQEGIKASGLLQSWTGYWDGRVSESGRQKDISMTLYQRSDGQIYGHLEEDGKTVPMMAVTTSPQSLTAQFDPDRKYIKIYLRPGEQNSLSGWVTSGDSSAQWALKGSLLGRVGNPKPAARSPKLVGRWQLDVRLPDGGTAYPVIDLNYESGDWTGTLLMEGRPLEVIQIWSLGPSAADDDGIFILAEEANAQPHSDASPGRQTARLQLEVSDQGRVVQGSVTWADKSAHITLSKGLSAEAIESKKIDHFSGSSGTF
ncbi:MAG: amidohydrolase family protein [Verrucomicrobia bacterium]|nr:amidohydrolase family protein [Verrucomicrobiota bacterium]